MINELCGCGNKGHYRSTIDGSWSCNKRMRCPTYNELRDQLRVANKHLSLYQKAINNLDDYFEYAMESKKDQKKVHQIIGNLTDLLKN